MPAPAPPAATRTRANFPADVNAPVQCGSRISAFAVYLLHAQFLPEDRLAPLMADLFGVRLTAATIARMSRSCAASLHGFGEAVRDLVADARVKHMDETGFRIGGKTQWLHACGVQCMAYLLCRLDWSRAARRDRMKNRNMLDEQDAFSDLCAAAR